MKAMKSEYVSWKDYIEREFPNFDDFEEEELV